MRALATALLTPPLVFAITVLAGIDLLDRDPCEGRERKPGCAERETAGDRWSRDQRIKRADGTTGVTQMHEDRSFPAVEPTCEEAARNEGRWPAHECAEPDPVEIIRQVKFPKPGLALMEVDNYGNVIIPAHADALVTHDGVGTPEIAGMDIRGSRCARSVDYAMSQTDGPFSVICLPREYGLYERMNGRPAPGPDEPVAPEE